ncbi:MAG: DNA polymerase I [Breznakibacter sp.]
MAETNKRLFLLDAYALIFRAYYAFIRNPRINSKGMNTSAILGFFNSLLEILGKEKPSHIAVAFDPAGPTFRHEMYPDYKAHRDETPEDIRKAVPIIKQLLEAMNIAIVQVPNFEADDVIGTLSKIAYDNGFETFMVTPDKDYAQLVNEKVFMCKPGSSGSGLEVIGRSEVTSLFSVDDPVQVVDVLGLWGDSADNIPGCPGIGEKKAKDIIAKYKSIENVYANIDDFSGKQKENLLAFKHQVEISKVLAKINTEVPLEWNEQYLLSKKPNFEQLAPLFEELEFKTLATRIRDLFAPPTPLQGSLFDVPVQQQDEASSHSFKTVKDTPHQYFLVDNEMAVLSLVAELSVQSEFCFDTETTGLDVYEAELVGMSFSWEPSVAYYVPVPADYDAAKELLVNFKSVFEDKSILKIGQNIKFDYMVLTNYGIDVKGPYFDTMVAHHLVNPGLRHNMDFLAETYLDYRPVSIDELIGKKGKGQITMRQVSVDVVTEYASEDADITYQLKLMLKDELEKEGLMDFFNSVEMPLVRVLASMEMEGVRLDAKELALYSTQLGQRIGGLEQEILGLAGEPFNIASPKQVGDILFEKLKIDPNAKKTKTGQFSTDEETLQKLKDKHPVVSKILEHRGLKKLLSTYVDALPALINAKTGRLHTSYNQAIVVTGRLSSTNPNLQNIPIRDEEGREIRKAFITRDENHVFLSADYSQVELRLMAHFSQDAHLIEAFNKGEDVHAATASRIFNVPLAEVTSDMRRKAKTANFGIIYGISSFGLAERLNIGRSEAKALIDGYFENFSGVKTFMETCVSNARQKGYASTLSGRKRYLPDIDSRNAVVRGVAERNAINAPIQGTAADIIKEAMVKIAAAFEKNGVHSKMILQVHDELNFDVQKDELEAVKSIVKECMENAVKLSVPLEVEMGVGTNWLEAH